MLNYQMFAILLQLNIWQSNRLLPSLRSLFPFSPYSPLQMPPLPVSLSPAALWSWATTLVSNVAPLALVLAHSMASSIVSSYIYAPVYKSLPRPVNQMAAIFQEVQEELENLEDRVSQPPPDAPHPDPSSPPDFEPATPRPSAAPSQHTATLQALEGRSTIQDDSSDDEDHEISQQTLITFDVEATEMTEATIGTWSAELRSANEPAPRETTYQITALTMLPPLLAAESFSSVLSGLMLIPLEAIMVRTVASAYRRSAGLGTADMFAGWVIPWRAVPNIIAVHAVEFAFSTAIWAAFTVVSQAMAGKYPFWGKADEGDEES